ncbi:MAG: DNA gyrase subunit A, partial [Chloroflexi bacterium HGW-Chloroflexi-1]
MELGTIRQINIDVEMQASYLDYAMSVIVARALPDVRDGLKPVHRRILYAMHDLGLSHDKSYKKSARIVGEVLGKYHPHGDAAVYEAMVRMAQDFSLRCTLVDGQGNFGSIDGDNAAAMRYTEARLAGISAEMLTDIEKGTVDWTENFDGTLKEPTVLPAALPNLLINGSSGIAVGMSTNIPPHNLGEVCDALIYLIDNYESAEDVTVEDLIQFIPGPDFPTGGLVYRYRHEGSGANQEQVDVITKAYASGRGRIIMQAKAHIEEMSRNRNRIVVTELPYQANKTNLLERIADLVRDGRLEGITDLRDESDRTGMRICIELTRTVDPRDVLANLFKLTPLQSTFGVSLLALVDGEPRLLSLKRILMYYLEHRQEVIVRRSKYELERARQRAHILEGLLRALDVLDEVIALIRKSKTADTARRNLIAEFKFTEIQAQAILDMQLRRLAALERRKLQDEYRAVIALIRDLEALLGSPKKVLALIRQNLLDLKARYADPRRTQIADRVKGTLTARDILPDQDVWITLAADGTLARQPVEPPNVARLNRLTRDASVALVAANTRQELYLFSAKGQAARVPIHQIPEGAGAHFADVSSLTRRDRVVALRAISSPEGEEPDSGLRPGSGQGYLLLGTAQGKVKRVTIADLLAQAHTDPQVIGLDDGDELAWVDVSSGGGEMLLVTASGQAIRFAEEDVRSMGLAASGIGGIKLG